MQQRPARLEDHGAIAAVYARAWPATVAHVASPEVVRELLRIRGVAFWAARLTEPGVHFEVSAVDSVVVGFVGWSSPDPRGAAELVWLFVDPSLAGRGIGGRLHDGALSAMEAAGSRAAHLWAVPGNDTAERFYARRGWLPQRETKDVPAGPGTFPLRLWQRSLPPA